MEEYRIYSITEDGVIEEYDKIKGKSFRESIQRYLDRKNAFNEELSVADIVFKKVFFDGYNVIKEENFKKVLRSLRHHDEVGLSNDIYDLLEEIKDDGGYIGAAFGGDLEGKKLEEVNDKIADLTDFVI